MNGQLLGGRYALVRRIGAGGMAEVWEADDRSLGRKVAVKLLHGHLGEDPSIVARFRTEAQAAARLTHPGVVAIYDTVNTGSSHAIIMELVEGEDLRSVLDERGSLAVDDAIEVAVQVSQALAAAHQAGVIHRDIKPANIMVRPDRRVKLSDFGIAKALDDTSHTESGSVVGTVKYLAPEQIEGHPVDGRTDLYALATVLFEMICGTVPFAASDLAGAMDRMNKVAPRARDRRPEVSASLDDFIATGLARNPDDRPADANAFTASLLALRRGDASEAPHRTRALTSKQALPPTATAMPKGRPPSIPMRAPEPTATPRTSRSGSKPKQRRRVRSLVGPLLAAALVVGALITVWLLLRPAPDRTGDGVDESTAPQAISTTSIPIAADVDEADDGPTTSSTSTSSTTSPTTTTTSTTLPPFNGGMRTLAFDPLGSGGEHGEIAQRAIDGNPETWWNTQSYKTRLFGGIKGGVGLVIEFENQTRVSSLDILASNQEWSGRIYEADRVESTLEGWGEPIKFFEGVGTELELELPQITTTALLLWITDLGVGEVDSNGFLRIQIHEITLTG